ncbi:MAG TPA: hypothetical protein PL072_11970, partial [Phycisphaerales bacterium]|nr:hypothetical protein [Phycisphaerales bacterium]
MEQHAGQNPKSKAWARWVLVAAAVGVLVWCGVAAWWLYTESAPFRQPYLSATAAQNEAVTVRLVVVLIGLPLGAAVLVACAGWRKLIVNRRGLVLLSAVWLAGAAHACMVRLLLPYGFGSAYEHASAEQMMHLRVASMVGGAGLVLAPAPMAAAVRMGRRVE